MKRTHLSQLPQHQSTSVESSVGGSVYSDDANDVSTSPASHDHLDDSVQNVLSPNITSVNITPEMRTANKNAYAALSLGGSFWNKAIATNAIFMLLVTVLATNCFVQDELYQKDFKLPLRWVFWILLLSAFASAYSTLTSRFTSITNELTGFLLRYFWMNVEGRELAADLVPKSKILEEFDASWQKCVYVPNDLVSDFEINVNIRKVCNTTKNDNIRLIRDKEMMAYYDFFQEYVRSQKRVKGDTERSSLLSDDDDDDDDKSHLSDAPEKLVIVTYKLPFSKYPTRALYWGGHVAVIYKDQSYWSFNPLDFFGAIPRYLALGLTYSMVTWAPAIAMWLTCNKSLDHIFKSWGVYDFFPASAKLIIYPVLYWASFTRMVLNNRRTGHYIWDYLHRIYARYCYGLPLTKKTNVRLFVAAALLTAVPTFFLLSFAITNGWFFFDAGITATANQITTSIDLINQFLPENLQGLNQIIEMLASVDPGIYEALLMFMRTWIVSSNVVLTYFTNVKPLFDYIYKKLSPAGRTPQAENHDHEIHNWRWRLGYLLLQLAVMIDSAQYGATAGYTTREILKKAGFDNIFVGELGQRIREVYPYVTAGSIFILAVAWAWLRADEGFTGTLDIFNTRKHRKVLAVAERDGRTVSSNVVPSSTTTAPAFMM